MLTVVGVRNAVLAAQELETARSALVEVQADDADLAAALPVLDLAQQSVEQARQRLFGPSVTMLRWVPVVGRSFDAERAVARAAHSSLAGVRALADAAPGLRTAGGVDVSALRSLVEELEPLAARADADLDDLRLVRTEWTPARVGATVSEVDQALTPVTMGLVQVIAGADLAAGLLGEDGPRNILVALGNNAELRGTGGFVSTFATGRVEAGTLSLDPFRDIRDVSDLPRAARPVPAPAEYVQDFGPFRADTTLWLEWTMSPDVPDSASVAATVAGELLGVTPDLVLLMDVPALTALVGLSGEQVRLPDGSTVPGDRLTEALLVDTYASAGDSDAQQSARRAALAQAAGDTAAAILSGDTAPLPLVRELGRLAAGRHLAVWSADEAEQAELERLGLAGSADPEGDDLALISVNNIGANKLDYYVQREVEVEAVVGLDTVEVVQRLRLSNQAPADLVPYVAGTDGPGTLVERVELSLAPQAEVASFLHDGAPALAELRPGAERSRVHTFIELPRGATTQFELRYSVPIDGGRYRLRLLPQALAINASLALTVSPAAGLTLTHANEAETGPVERTGPWSETEIVDVMSAEPGSVRPAAAKNGGRGLP